MRVDKLYEVDAINKVFAGNGNCIAKNSELLKKSQAKLIWHPSWYLTVKSAATILRWTRWFREFGGALIVACNDPNELRLCRLLGIPCKLLNQNMHESENSFKIVNLNKNFDAIHIAQARKFKRMWLASEVEPLFVLTYRCAPFVNEVGENDLAAFEPRIAHASWNKGFMHDKQEVSSVISSSYAGLALSKKEGAMWASVQYLLCGIPVVTTPSKGGRDHFLGENLSYFSAPTPSDVRIMVNRVKSEQRNPYSIRRIILSKMEKERYRYMQFLQEDLLVLEKSEFASFYKRVWGGV